MVVLEELDLVVDCARRQIGLRPESSDFSLLKLKHLVRHAPESPCKVLAILGIFTQIGSKVRPLRCLLLLFGHSQTLVVRNVHNFTLTQGRER